MVCVYIWLLMLVRPTTCAQCHQQREGETVAAQTSDSGKEGHNCCGAHTHTHTRCSFFWICSSFTPHLTIFPLRLWGLLEVLVSGPEFSRLNDVFVFIYCTIVAAFSFPSSLNSSGRLEPWTLSVAKVGGLQLEGCSFDGVHLCENQHNSPSVSAVPQCHMAWVPKVCVCVHNPVRFFYVSTIRFVQSSNSTKTLHGCISLYCSSDKLLVRSQLNMNNYSQHLQHAVNKLSMWS